MKSNEINKKVEILISKILNIKSIPHEASQNNIAEWDSLAYLSIIDKLEEEFKLKINQDNINNFGSVKSIVKEIELCKNTIL